MENRISMDTNAANKLVNDTIDALTNVIPHCKNVEQIVQVAEVVAKLQQIILDNGIKYNTMKHSQTGRKY